MKVLIEIDKKTFKDFHEFVAINIGRRSGKTIIEKCLKAISKGTPVPDNVSTLSVTEFADKCRECGIKNFIRIPDNATYGNVIMAMFPNAKIRRGLYGINGIPLICLNLGTRCDVHEMSFVEDLWDAPYKGGE